MKHSTISSTAKTRLYFIFGAVIVTALFFLSLFVGKYPLSLQEILAGNEMHQKVLINLRLSRALVGVCGGFALGISGFVYQIIFKNQLASPDIIGVSSGASAGAAAGILFLGSSLYVTAAAFGGALCAVILSLAFSSLDKTGKKSTVVLAGIAVHSLAQTCLMCLKLVADPEKELASIEYWIMGSLNGISMHSIGWNLLLAGISIVLLSLLHRQILLLSTGEDEAKLLGVNVAGLRFLVLLLATILVSCIISMTGLISFVGLIAPHIARRLTKRNNLSTMFLGGIAGAIILTGADILARSVSQAELPVSIFTSLIGAPFLIFLIGRRKENL